MKRNKKIFQVQRRRAGNPIWAHAGRVLLALLSLVVANRLFFSGTAWPGGGQVVKGKAGSKTWSGDLAVPPDVPLVPICAIQGGGYSSPYEGELVRTGGVVVADLDTTAEKAFYLQAPDCDTDPASSDGLLVYLGVRTDVVQSGDLVEVVGLVQEYFGQTELAVSPEDVMILSTGNPLPPPGELAPPFDNSLARGYYEAREGMYVGMQEARVVGPTSLFGETWVIQANLGLERVFQNDPAGTGEVVLVGERGHAEVQPPAQVGDGVSGLVGVLGYSGGMFELLLTEEPVVQQQGDLSQPQPVALRTDPSGGAGAFSFTVATFNLHNLFDTVDDPLKDDPVVSATTYERHLNKLALTIQQALGAPTLLAVQEVENEGVLADLVARPELETDYGIVWLDGPDRRGIDVALLYRLDRAVVVSYVQRQGCTLLVDGLGPDGNQDVIAPQNAVTCDSDGDGVPDGNRLFSRPPLEVLLRVCAGDCQLLPGQTTPSLDLWLLVNHFKSKSQDTDWTAYTLPRRRAQAEFAAGWVAQHQADPGTHILVLGDLNDYPDSEPLGVLTGVGLENLSAWIDGPERYTYIYQGVSQVLDYLLAGPALLDEAIQVSGVHTNADYPAVLQGFTGTVYRASDHDAVVARFTVLPEKDFLPLGINGFRHPDN